MRDTSRAVPFAAGARAAFGLTLDAGMLGRRSLVIGVLIGLPVLFALIYRIGLASRLPAETTAFDLYGGIVLFYWVRNVLPLAALFFGTALVADEVEGKTITFLLTRPVARASILAGKFAAYVVTALALLLPALLTSFALLLSAQGLEGLRAHAPDLLRDMGVAALTLVVYGALFTLFGVLLRRPLIPGLMFLFVWELLANAPGYVPRFTITAWLRSLLPYRPPSEGVSALFGQGLPVGLSLVVLAGVAVVSLGAAFGAFARREYVLEQ